MLQSFDRKIPLSEQRYCVAMAKSCRNHGKRHAVKRRSIKHKLKLKNRQKHKIAQQQKETYKRHETARQYWSGQCDELRP